MNPSNDKAPTPADIEARQDTVLRQLEELERRIVQVLAEHGVSIELSAPGPVSLRMAETGPQLANIADDDADDAEDRREAAA